jgi:hypothetical protein
MKNGTCAFKIARCDAYELQPTDGLHAEMENIHEADDSI